MRASNPSEKRPKAPVPEKAKRPVVPAVPSESAVGEEDPGDFENASILRDNGLPSPNPPPPHARR